MSPYVYDIVPVVIMLLCIGTGYKRGVLRTVLGLICMVIAFSIASVLSSPEICAGLYDKYLHDRISVYIQESVDEAKVKIKEQAMDEAQKAVDEFIDENFGGSELLKESAKDFLAGGDEFAAEAVPELYDFVGVDIRTLLTNPEISGKIETVAAKYSSVAAEEINRRLPLGITVKQSEVYQVLADVNASEALIYELFGIKSENSEAVGAADYIERRAVRPIFVRFIGIVIWAVVFSVVNFLLRIIVRVILIIRKIEPVKACDSLLGGALGAAAGLAVIAACCTLIVLLVNFTGGMTYMNEGIFEQTVYFKQIYDIIAGLEFVV